MHCVDLSPFNKRLVIKEYLLLKSNEDYGNHIKGMQLTYLSSFVTCFAEDSALKLKLYFMLVIQPFDIPDPVIIPFRIINVRNTL